MTLQIRVDPDCRAERWISYLDLLGFTELVRTKGWRQVFSQYSRALEHFIKDRGFEPKIEKTWFSDTFIMYSYDDTGPSFAAIEATTRWFIYFLISAGIPVRGAMACGEFYADKLNNLFFGQALIEAYHYGENQDWIGFVLTPSAVNQMDSIGLPANKRLNYAFWKIPYKTDDGNFSEFLPAYILGGSGEINGKNPCYIKLIEIQDGLHDSKIRKKYENTIRFIEENKRTIVKN